MKKLTVLMIHSENSGVGAYRVWQQAKYLEQAGWEVRRLPNQPPMMPNDSETGRTSPDPSIRRAYEKHGSWQELAEGIDLLVVQRTDNPEGLALALGIGDYANCPVVYEIDDNIWDVSENSPSYKFWHKGSPYFDVAEMFMKNVDAITTTTPYLAEILKGHNRHVYVLPNCQDPDLWRWERPRNEDKVVIGWAGSNSHYDDLEIIKPAIKRILKRHPEAIFRVIGTLPDFFTKMKQVDLRRDIVAIVKWQEKLAELNFDIGLAPVVKRPFNLAKSGIKWQEYAMLGIPTIASDIGTYSDIDNGVDGILTNNDPKNWEAAIEDLLSDKSKREAIGVAAKQRVLADFNISKNIGQWDHAYRDIIDRFKSVSS